jgi:alkaline phosphatase
LSHKNKTKEKKMFQSSRRIKDDNITSSEVRYIILLALQLIDYPYGDGIEVALGGGWRSFYKCETIAPDGKLLNDSKCRLDGKDLTKEWLDKFSNSAYVSNRTQLKDIDPKKVDHLLGR